MKQEYRAVDLNAENGTIRVVGDLVMSTAAAAVQHAGALFRDRGDALVFDLAQVNHCDSAALAVLLEWRREALRQGRALAWKNVPDRLRQLATISELSPVLQLDSAG